ncbi:hypothetical protein D3C76_1727050 [compost metagenome]
MPKYETIWFGFRPLAASTLDTAVPCRLLVCRMRSLMSIWYMSTVTSRFSVGVATNPRL